MERYESRDSDPVADANPSLGINTLIPEVYTELRFVAKRHIRNERAADVLEPAALVHETYLRLARRHRPSWKGRSHFLSIASKTMKNILVDQARRRRAAKRSGRLDGIKGVPVELISDETAPLDLNLVALGLALEKLDQKDPLKRRIVELRYIAGYSIEETARALHSSPGTVKRHWTGARAWLRRELSGG